MTLCWLPAVPPEPLRVSAAGELVASLTNERLPGALPLAVGENVTEKEILFPAGTVTGNEMPLNVYPWPVWSTVETCTSELPAVSVPFFAVLLLPTATLPKFMAAGATLSCPAAGADPLPVREMVAAESDALEEIARLPVAEPTVRGLNDNTIVALVPGAIENGTDGEETIPKASPVSASCDTVIVSDLELLLTVKELVWLLPTGRLPKSIDELAELSPVEEEIETLLPGAVPPPHPTNGVTAKTKSASRYRRGIIVLHLTT